jgi:hypothetical protein
MTSPIPESTGFRVTVEDLETGDKSVMDVVPGDLMLIPFAPAFKAHSMHYASTGTTVITVKDHRPEWPAREVEPGA